MARFVRGLANAYQNQLNWQAKHRRDIDAGDTSLFGVSTALPHIQNGWNHLMFVPALMKGFVFGEDLQPVPTVDIAEGLRETDWGKDMVRYQQTEQQINQLRVNAVEDQVMGVLTLNLGRFNQGRATNEAIAHAQEKLNEVILPLKGNDQGQEVQTPNLILPKVPQDIQKTLTYSTGK